MAGIACQPSIDMDVPDATDLGRINGSANLCHQDRTSVEDCGNFIERKVTDAADAMSHVIC